MLRSIVTIFGIILTLGAYSSDSVGKGAKKAKTVLFDLKKRTFDEKTGPEDRVALEDQFIRQGRLYEKNPINYFNELLFNKMLFQDAKRTLYDYKDDYYFRFQISNHFFEDAESFKKLDSWALDDMPHSYLFKRLHRKQKLLDKLWDAFGESIVDLLRPHFKRGSNQLKYIDGLLRTFDCLSRQEDYKNKFDEILEKLDEFNPEPYEMIDFMEPILCSDIETEFERKEGSDYYKWQDVQWLHSFWVRRHKEGNTDLALKVLRSFSLD